MLTKLASSRFGGEKNVLEDLCLTSLRSLLVTRAVVI